MLISIGVKQQLCKIQNILLFFIFIQLNFLRIQHFAEFLETGLHHEYWPYL